MKSLALLEKTIINNFRLWANDENLTGQHVIAITRSLTSFLDDMIARGALSAGQFGAELALYYHWSPSEINQMDWLDVIAYREELARLKNLEYESHQLG
ncbi:hypothetical protein ME9_01300 [Bartonella taylorii 8TBB]|uniref:Uncharacterized protein n=1 Tax=Bartonella taylorii 8TBB TaxID=1094560 RepID=A0A9P2RYS1_BARTA|nr:hypothetical protein ME9_01300 [Bartonella taylorii 8TBB]